MTNPWLDPSIAAQQRALVDAQLHQSPVPAHFAAFAEAIRATNCPGEILDVGCASGYGREILDRAGVEYRSYTGLDISAPALAIAKERYPESTWRLEDASLHGGILAQSARSADVVVDACALMHVDDWRAHLAALCAASRRWVVLHRVPTGSETLPTQTQGYGQTFPAWRFNLADVAAEMRANGFAHTEGRSADGDSLTVTFAKARQYATYCDSNYLPRLKALHASMVRHCGPFELHVLAWDQGVAEWCDKTVGVVAVEIEDFTAAHPELWIDKLPGPPRTRVEHMWTVGPAFLASVMERTGEPVCYVDADLLFFSSPEPVFAEIGGAPAAVVPHGFAEASRGLPGPTRETHEVFGRFNVGIVYCADRTIAEAWAEATRGWCYDRLERRSVLLSMGIDDDVFYGDQRFLDAWPERYGAHVITHPGACAGPWAANTRSIDVRDGVIYWGNRPLVSYHFSGLQILPHGADVLTRPEYCLSERIASIVYPPYLRALKDAK